MDIAHLEKVIQLLEKYQLTEISYNDESSKVSIKKELPSILSSSVVSSPLSFNSTPQSAVKPSPEPSSCANTRTIKATLVGTFYRATDPNSPPLAIVGQKVSKGDSLGLIEAMKVLSLISSPCDGILEEVLIDNGQVVQFDQPLFTVLSTEN
jgi:acetyl-CoA carboxylase biotin carboxyl carrier protein